MQKLKTIPIDSPDLAADLQAAVTRLLTGVRDPEAVRNACDRMDQMRAEMRERIGEVEEAVNLIREARDDL